MSKLLDSLGDRMKLYEQNEAGRKLLPLLPIVCRLDGRAFHSFCKGLTKPYDEGMSKSMIEATTELVKLTNATVGYTQSDEITLVWKNDTLDAEMFFAGKIQKLVSVLASMATLYFNKAVERNLTEEYVNKLPMFDARVWQVPNLTEAYNCLLWREQDAIKNSISMTGQKYIGHAALIGKHSEETKAELLEKHNIDWTTYPDFFKRGTYIRRGENKSKFTEEELAKLPPKHAARTNPDLVISRNSYDILDIPFLDHIENPLEVLFAKRT